MFAGVLHDRRTSTEVKAINVRREFSLSGCVSSRRSEFNCNRTTLLLLEGIQCLAQGHLRRDDTCQQRSECWLSSWRTTSLTAQPPCGSNHSAGNWDYQGLKTLRANWAKVPPQSWLTFSQNLHKHWVTGGTYTPTDEKPDIGVQPQSVKD